MQIFWRRTPRSHVLFEIKSWNREVQIKTNSYEIDARKVIS
jgi:hypothetical protein